MYKQAVYNISQMKLFKNRKKIYILTYHITHFIHKKTSRALWAQTGSFFSLQPVSGLGYSPITYLPALQESFALWTQ